MTTPHKVLTFPRRGSYQESVRKQQEASPTCNKSLQVDPGKQAAIDGLDMAIRKAYAVLGPEEANGTVQWTHANVHTEYVKR